MAIELGNTSSNNGGSGTSTSWSHTCAAGSNVLVVSVAYNGTNDRMTHVKYNSVALTKAGTNRNYDGGGLAHIYYLVDPPTGSSYTIECAFSFNVGNVEAASDYSGADTSDVKGGANGSGQTWSSTTTDTRTLTTETDDSVIVCCIRMSGTDIATPDGSLVEIYDEQNSAHGYLLTGTAGSHSVKWTYASSIISAYAMEIRAGSAGGPATLKTFDTVAAASIKTTNGTAQASVKTMDGVA